MRNPMQPRRPALVTWVAVFHLIFGGLGLLCGVGVGATQLTGVGKQGGPPPANEPPPQQEWRKFQETYQERMEQDAPWAKSLAPAHTAVNLLLLLLLVAAGLGLLLMRKWGWWASVVFGALCLSLQIYYLLFHIFYFYPVGSRVVEEELPNYPALSGSPAILLGCRLMPALFALLAGLIMIYPLLVLLVMFLPSVRAAFRGESWGRAPAGYEGGPGDDGGPPGAGRAPGGPPEGRQPVGGEHGRAPVRDDLPGPPD
jgi:hypothetical protein